MRYRLVLAVIGFPLALATLLQDEENVLCDSKDCPESKSLLQGTFPHSRVLANRGAPKGPMLLPQRAHEECPLDISGVANAPGNSEPLDAAGFENVRACCCPAQMRAFIRRLVQADTNVVCNEGGLGGLTLFYYCTDGDPEHDFDKLVAAVGADSDAQRGACPWIGLGPKESMCPPQNQDPTVCRSFPGVTEEPCIDCATSTTITTTTTTTPKVISLKFRIDNIDYHVFAQYGDLQAALGEKVKSLIIEKVFSLFCQLTPQELEFMHLNFSKGSLLVEVLTALVHKEYNAEQVANAYLDWAHGKNGSTMYEDMSNAVNQVPGIDKVVTNGDYVTGIGNIVIKMVNTFKAEPCPSEFPWCNPNGLYCEKAWCRYYEGCDPSSNYAISRSCSIQYVPNCNTPTTIGYDFKLAGGTTTIVGFNPSGVACADGYVGKVSYTACSSAEEKYLVSGCQLLESISYKQKCSKCYCSDIIGHSLRKRLRTNVTREACVQACNNDPDCGFINYYPTDRINFNCYSCPFSGWHQVKSNSDGEIVSKVLDTEDWYGVSHSAI